MYKQLKRGLASVHLAPVLCGCSYMSCPPKGTLQKNFKESGLLQITLNPQIDSIESDFNAIFIEKHCFYGFKKIYKN